MIGKTSQEKILTSKNTGKILKMVHRFLNLSERTLKVGTNELNNYFNKTTTCLIASTTRKVELKILMKSFSEKNGFQLNAVWYKELAQSL